MEQSGLLIFCWGARPATSYVAATFHPTIGQLAHQSLSNAATPELGMIPPRIRVNAGLHITKGIQSANQTQLGLTGLQQSAKPAQSEDQPLHTRSKTIPSQSCEESKTTSDSPKQKVRHSSILQGNSELFLALTWPKQLSYNPKLGYFHSHKHPMKWWQPSTVHNG